MLVKHTDDFSWSGEAGLHRMASLLPIAVIIRIRLINRRSMVSEMGFSTDWLSVLNLLQEQI